MYTTEIKNLEPKRLAAVRHIGDYMKVDKAFQSVMMWGAKEGLITDKPEMIGIYYDDPSAVDTDKLRTDAGIVIGDDIDVDALAGSGKVRTVDIAGGRHAVVTFKGPYAELHNGYNWLFTSWLPESGEEAGENPVFEVYLNDPRSTAPSELLTDICLPLKG